MVKETCASRMRKALTLRNMTQSQLCEKTDIPKSAISQYLSGAFEPKQDRVHLIAKALDVSEAWLMGYDVAFENRLSSNAPLGDKGEDVLLPAYLSFAQSAQDNGISPDDIRMALDMIKKLRGGDQK